MKPLQPTGLMVSWQSPNKKFVHTFAIIDLQCELDNYPGILIISDISNTPLLVKNVANLRNDFQELRNSIDYQIEVKVYWSSVTDLHDLNGTEERHKIVSGLTDHPVLIG
ncbi:MAG: hypothetical protein RPR97_10315 [Colwellia sp.]